MDLGDGAQARPALPQCARSLREGPAQSGRHGPASGMACGRYRPHPPTPQRPAVKGSVDCCFRFISSDHLPTHHTHPCSCTSAFAGAVLSAWKHFQVLSPNCLLFH